MNSYEFSYHRRDLHALKQVLASWCAERDCVLETTTLLDGARLRISGPDATVREAIRQVRAWMRLIA